MVRAPNEVAQPGCGQLLDLCETPEKCEAYLTKVMVQLEELEGRFAEFDENIQHTHPEFLRKFISLCDGQRSIDGVHNGRAKTYDLRAVPVLVDIKVVPAQDDEDRIESLSKNPPASPIDIGPEVRQGERSGGVKLGRLWSAGSLLPLCGRGVHSEGGGSGEFEVRW